MKKKLRYILSVILVIVYFTPIILIVVLAKIEMKSYENNESITIVEKAYGEICQVERKDIKECCIVDVTGVSNQEQFIKVANDSNVVWKVEIGDEVFYGQTLGISNGKKVKSMCNGIISHITNRYVKMKSLDKICLQAEIDEEQISYFQKKLYDEKGNSVKNIKVSNQIKEGKITVKFELNQIKCKFGEKIENLKLFTGKTYKNVLVVNKDCVYKKSENSGYYVRIVDEYGDYLEEVEVEVGYNDGKNICITGVKEGSWCDTGYKTFEDNDEVDTNE